MWPSGGQTGPEDFPLLQNTSCLLFSCNVTAHSSLPCHTLTCTICYFCVIPYAHRLDSWLGGPSSLGRTPHKQITIWLSNMCLSSNWVVLSAGGSLGRNDDDQSRNHIWQGDMLSLRCVLGTGHDDLMRAGILPKNHWNQRGVEQKTRREEARRGGSSYQDKLFNLIKENTPRWATHTLDFLI